MRFTDADNDSLLEEGDLLVDELLGQQQVVIKSLGRSLSLVRGVSGGAIMPDGKVELILDVPAVVSLAWEV